MASKVKKSAKKPKGEKKPVVTQGNRNDRETGAKLQKKQEAIIYALWCSIPFVLRTMKEEQLEDMGYGLDKENIYSRLIHVKNKSEFSVEFNVSRKELVVWDTHPWVQEKVKEFEREGDVSRHKKEVDAAFTAKTIQEADSARVRLWYEIHQGWTSPKPKGENDNEEIRQLAALMRAFAEKK